MPPSGEPTRQCGRVIIHDAGNTAYRLQGCRQQACAPNGTSMTDLADMGRGCDAGALADSATSPSIGYAIQHM
eukprot:2069530-Karenia_brevis.AAC.1